MTRPVVLNRRALLASVAALAASPAFAADTPKTGGILSVGIDDDAKTFNPALSVQLSERQVLHCVYNTLLAIDVDFSVKPELARSWTVENDGLRYVFQLADGVSFHDGTPFNADAVKWNIEHRLDPANASPQRSLLAPVIASIEALSPTRVAFNLKAPHPALLSDLADRAGFMMSPAGFTKYGPDFGRNPIGTGAFLFKSWTQGSSIELTRNPNYWEKGLPYLDGIIFRDIPNHVVGLQRMSVGEIDIITSLSPDDLRQIETNPDFTIQQARVGRWYSLQWQVDKPPFNNVKLRQAIAYALDRKKINDLTMRGRATLANGPTPPGLWWSSADEVVYDFNPEKSRARLAEAGVAPGTSFQLSVSTDLVLRKIDQVVVEQLAAVGLTVQLQPVSEAESYARVVQRAINFTPISWTQRADPDGLLYILFDSKGFANSTGYNNPEVDKRLEEARQLLDQDRRKTLYREVKGLIQQDLPYISLFFAAEYAAFANQVSGFVWPPDQIPRYRRVWKA